jgi:hypothetical protein
VGGREHLKAVEEAFSFVQWEDSHYLSGRKGYLNMPGASRIGASAATSRGLFTTHSTGMGWSWPEEAGESSRVRGDCGVVSSGELC